MISLSSLKMFCCDVESEPVEPKLFCVEPVPRLTILALVPRLMVQKWCFCSFVSATVLYNIICTVQYDRSLFLFLLSTCHFLPFYYCISVYPLSLPTYLSHLFMISLYLLSPPLLILSPYILSTFHLFLPLYLLCPLISSLHPNFLTPICYTVSLRFRLSPLLSLPLCLI